MVGEVLMFIAALVWFGLTVMFALKWVFSRPKAIEEANHPVQCCFIGLAGVATMLIALGVLPHSRTAAHILFWPGAVFTLGFALWRTGLLWQGERDPGTTTPVLYLPSVAGGFVTAIVLSALGYPEWGQFPFGASALSWLAIESVLLHRLYMGPSMPPALRPTLGIQLAPPVVGAVAYLSVNQGVPDLVAHGLVGYGLLQAFLLLRLLPWIMRQPFSASYWGFTFGVTALATAPLRMIAAGDTGPVATMGPYLFMGANVAVGAISLATLGLILKSALRTMVGDRRRGRSLGPSGP
jgi:tellurite resistance protein